MARQGRKNKTAAIPAWSWAVAALGLLLVTASTGFMLFKAFAGDASPPQIAVELQAIVPGEDVHLVQIRVANHGGTAAAGVVVEGVLAAADDRETSTITLDHVPSKSHRNAGLYFTQDPRRFELHLRAKGYEEP